LLPGDGEAIENSVKKVEFAATKVALQVTLKQILGIYTNIY
jgi:hypothetical protein